MTDVATLAAKLSTTQVGILSVFLSGPMTAETGAARLGFRGGRSPSDTPVRPYAWWGRLMKQLPPDLVRSEWRARDQELLWSLTPLGADVLQALVRSRLENAA